MSTQPPSLGIQKPSLDPRSHHAESQDSPLGLVAALTQGVLPDNPPPAPNSYWVVPGSFAAGEYPGDVDPARAAIRLRRLLEAGIDHFINLTQPHELEPYDGIAEEQARALGITVGHEHLPIVDLNTPDSPRYMNAILDAIDDALADGRTVYIHCWAGVGRTGTVVGCWLVRHGRIGDEALAQIAEFVG